MSSNQQTKNLSLVSNKKQYAIINLLLLFVFISAFSGSILAQRTVVVEPDNYPAEVGNINITIEGDTTATGERVDENTIYILKRDAVYWFDGRLTNQGGYHLNIQAEEGDGHPPVLRPAIDLIGSSQNLIDAYGDLTLKGLYLSHIDDQASLKKNPIRVVAENSTVIIDNCWFDYDEQSWVRLNNSGVKVFITNTKGRNGGRNDGSGNGRILDTRGNGADSILIQNSTFYNLQNNPVSGGGFINYLKFDHNTIVDAAGGFSLGTVMELELTNNLLVNIGFKGTRTNDPEYSAIFQFDSAENIEGISDSDRELRIANNNFDRPIDQLSFEGWGDLYGPYRTEMQAIIDGSPDTVIFNRPLFDSAGVALLNANMIVMENNFVDAEDNLSFTDRSSFEAVVAHMDHYIFHTDDVDNYPLMWDKPESRGTGSSTADWRDFSYSTSSESYTGAEGGLPVGDLNWFPGKKELWASGTTVSNENDEVIAAGFSLNQNYPNPFNPSTNISFELAQASEVNIAVYDMLGRKVSELVSGRMTAGSHSVTFNASELSSGLYIARMQSSTGAVRSIRMMLIK